VYNGAIVEVDIIWFCKSFVYCLLSWCMCYYYFRIYFYLIWYHGITLMYIAWLLHSY